MGDTPILILFFYFELQNNTKNKSEWVTVQARPESTSKLNYLISSE